MVTFYTNSFQKSLKVENKKHSSDFIVTLNGVHKLRCYYHLCISGKRNLKRSMTYENLKPSLELLATYKVGYQGVSQVERVYVLGLPEGFPLR